MQGDGGRRVIEDKGRILRVRASRSKSKISGRLTAYLFICSGIIREGDTLQKIDNTFVDHLDVSGVGDRVRECEVTNVVWREGSKEAAVERR